MSWPRLGPGFSMSPWILPRSMLISASLTLVREGNVREVRRQRHVHRTDDAVVDDGVVGLDREVVLLGVIGLRLLEDLVELDVVVLVTDVADAHRLAGDGRRLARALREDVAVRVHEQRQVDLVLR